MAQAEKQWDFGNEHVLVLGIGGGSDVVCAYALSRLVRARLASYGNTKARCKTGRTVAVPGCEWFRTVSDWLPADAEVDRHGTCNIEHRVPREGGSPLILVPETDGPALARDLRHLGVDRVLALDTGGDCLNGRGTDDLETLGLLSATGIALQLVVLAPGLDGESSYEELEGPMQGWEARFPLASLVPELRQWGRYLKPTRTPNLVVRACEGRLAVREDGRVEVPRGEHPIVPLEWLLHGYLFSRW